MNPDLPDEIRKQLAEYIPFQEEMEARQAHDIEVMKKITDCIMRWADRIGIDATYQIIEKALKGGIIRSPVDDYIKFKQSIEQGDL